MMIVPSTYMPFSTLHDVVHELPAPPRSPPSPAPPSAPRNPPPTPPRRGRGHASRVVRHVTVSVHHASVRGWHSCLSCRSLITPRSITNRKHPAVTVAAMTWSATCTSCAGSSPHTITGMIFAHLARVEAAKERYLRTSYWHTVVTRLEHGGGVQVERRRVPEQVAGEDDADGGDHHRDEAVHGHQEHARGEHLHLLGLRGGAAVRNRHQALLQDAVDAEEQDTLDAHSEVQGRAVVARSTARGGSSGWARGGTNPWRCSAYPSGTVPEPWCADFPSSLAATDASALDLGRGVRVRGPDPANDRRASRHGPRVPRAPPRKRRTRRTQPPRVGVEAKTRAKRCESSTREPAIRPT